MMHRDDLTGRDLQENTSNISDLANRDGSSAEVDAILTKTDTVSDSLDLTEDEVDVDNILDAIKDDYEQGEWRTVMNAALDRRKRETKAEGRYKGQRIVRRISAIAASVVVCALVTGTAAYAFNWKAFFEFFAPISEMFSFVTPTTGTDEIAVPELHDVHGRSGIVFEDDETSSSIAYSDYDRFITDNPEAQGWLEALPEGTVFFSGERFENLYTTNAFAVFWHGGAEIFFKKFSERGSNAFLFEISSDEIDYVNLNGINVTLYRNMSPPETIGASWQDGKSVMNIWTENPVTQAWLEQIVNELTKGRIT